MKKSIVLSFFVAVAILGGQAQAAENARITSYNVCYTKLLRVRDLVLGGECFHFRFAVAKIHQVAEGNQPEPVARGAYFLIYLQPALQRGSLVMSEDAAKAPVRRLRLLGVFRSLGLSAQDA